MTNALRMGLVVALAALVGSGVGASDARAGLTACSDSRERPFAQWGDYAYYRLAPNGSFDDGSDGWSLSGGATVVRDGNPLVSGDSSLLLPSGGSATAPAACVKLADLASRFFVKGNGSSSGSLRVDVTYRSVLGLFTITSNLGTISAGNHWQPSPKYGHVLENLLGTLALNSNISASLRFKFTARGGDFQVDDLFVDPLLQV